MMLSLGNHYQDHTRRQTVSNEHAIEKLKEISFMTGYKEALNLATKALKENEELMNFARFVAKEVLDDNFKDDADSFTELACRKLVKLGLLKVECGFYKEAKNELCETCKKRNSCSDSTKDFSNYVTAKCFKYEREEADND